MSDTPESRPALTPELWAVVRSGGTIEAHPFSDDAEILYMAPRIPGIPGQQALRLEMPGDRHALAALCLHEQTFGFTQADVEFLRDMISEIPSNETEADEWGEKFYRLAQRIAALLPPIP